MGSEDRVLYEYYQRYLWNPVDFDRFQDNIVGLQRDAFGDLHGAGLLEGGAVTPGTGMQIAYAAFSAMNDDGYLCVKEAGGTASLAASHATLHRYDLIVARPLEVDDITIARPELPGDEVVLTKFQRCSVVVIQGANGASPSVPSKVAGDVILASVYVAATVTSISGGVINQTTHKDIGECARFASSAKDLILRSRTAGVPALLAYGGATGDGARGYSNGSGYGLYGIGNAGTDASGIRGDAGSGGGYGGIFVAKDGLSSGADADDIASANYGNVLFAGSDPAPTTGFTNQLTPMNLIKGWALINLAAGTITVISSQGFNVASVTAPGTSLIITIADNLAGEGAVFCTWRSPPGANATCHAIVDSGAGAVINVIGHYDGGATVDMSTATCSISVMWLGAQ